VGQEDPRTSIVYRSILRSLNYSLLIRESPTNEDRNMDWSTHYIKPSNESIYAKLDQLSRKTQGDLHGCPTFDFQLHITLSFSTWHIHPLTFTKYGVCAPIVAYLLLLSGKIGQICNNRSKCVICFQNTGANMSS
jgi:hypothetical protein